MQNVVGQASLTSEDRLRPDTIIVVRYVPPFIWKLLLLPPCHIRIAFNPPRSVLAAPCYVSHCIDLRPGVRRQHHHQPGMQSFTGNQVQV